MHPSRRQPRPAAGGARGLERALERSDRFRRDTGLGAIYHRGKISFRELSSTDSLHVVIDGSRVSAHADRVSPLKCGGDGSVRYSFARILAHNLYGMGGDLGRLVSGRRHGRRKVELDLGWVDDESAVNSVAEMVDAPGAALTPKDDGSKQAGPAPTAIPFSVVDQAVHLLETEAEPWSIQMEVRVAGRLDESRVRAALAQALSSHPMARARKAPTHRSLPRDHWEIPPEADLDPLRVVDCRDDTGLAATRAELQSLAVPLAESPPLRMRLARHPQGDVLMFNANHAAMDAFGVLRVIFSLARAYVGEPEPVSGLDSLQARNVLGELARADLPTRIRRHVALAEKLRDLVSPPARLAPEGGSGRAGYGFHQASLSVSETRALLSAEDSGTVNDVLLCALHLAIAGWNAEHGEPCRRIGVLVPANLRPPEWRREVVGNFSLPARVSTSGRNRRSPEAALRALRAQTVRKKRTGMGTALVAALERTGPLPLWAKQAMVLLMPVTANRLVDTAMLSNLGRLEQAPSFGSDAGSTTEVWFSAPGRMPLGLTIGAVTVGGRLHLTFRYRHQLFSSDAARAFADRYLSELNLLIERPAGRERRRRAA